HCCRPHVARPAMVARWPALASPWLPASTRRASTLPPLSPDCADDGRGAVATLRIEGLAEGAVLARPPGSARGIRVSLRAVGTDAPVQWLLDGRRIATTRGANPFLPGVRGGGQHRRPGVADPGAWASSGFRVLGPDTGGGAGGGGGGAGGRPSGPAAARVQPPSASSTCSALETLN